MSFKTRVVTLLLGISMVIVGIMQPIVGQAWEYTINSETSHIHRHSSDDELWTGSGDEGHYRTFEECSYTSGGAITTSAACQHTEDLQPLSHTYGEEGKCTACGYAHVSHLYDTATPGACTVCNLAHTRHDYSTATPGACVVCFEEHTSHNYGADDTCTICHKAKPEGSTHTHTYRYEQIINNATSHSAYYACIGQEGCEVTGADATAPIEEAHNFPIDGQVNICTLCGYDKTPESVDPGVAITPGAVSPTAVAADNTTVSFTVEVSGIYSVYATFRNTNGNTTPLTFSATDLTGQNQATLNLNITTAAPNGTYRLTSLFGYTTGGDSAQVKRIDLTGVDRAFTVSIPRIPGPGHVHDYTYGSWQMNSTHHWRVATCSILDSIVTNHALSSHVAGSWQTTLHPTSTQYGTEKRFCTTCDYEMDSRQISPTGGGSSGGGSSSNNNTNKDLTTDNSYNIVTALKELGNGGTITATYDGKPVLPANVFDALRGTTKKLELTSRNGATWVFDGRNIKNSSKEINLEVKAGTVTEQKAEDQRFINQIVGTRETVVLAFADNGTLPGAALVTIPLKNNMVGLLGWSGIYLYYVNSNAGTVDLIARNLTIDNGMNITISVDHNSTFILTKGPIGANDIVPAPNTNANTNTSTTTTTVTTTTTTIIRPGNTSPRTGNWFNGYYWLGIILAGLGLIVASLLYLEENRLVLRSPISKRREFIGYRDARDYLEKYISK